MSDLFFYFFASMAIAFSLLTILKKNPVSSAFSLVMVFFCFAAIYAIQGAHLLAGLQVLVYTGAIMVLFVFVIMLLNVDVPQFDLKRTPSWMKGIVLVLGAGFVLYFAKLFNPKNLPDLSTFQNTGFSNEAITAAGGNAKVVARLMFSEYLLPFELTSALLLLAIVGSVVIAKRRMVTGGNK